MGAEPRVSKIGAPGARELSHQCADITPYGAFRFRPLPVREPVRGQLRASRIGELDRPCGATGGSTIAHRLVHWDGPIPAGRKGITGCEYGRADAFGIADSWRKCDRSSSPGCAAR